MKLPKIHFDCKYFMGDRPCFPNKEQGIFCGNCSYYEKNESLEEFPEIGEPDTEGNNEAFKKIIIVKLDAVGDVLRTTSILPSLKRKYTDSSIVWITKEKSFDVLKDNELIDEIYFDTDDLINIYNDLFDIAINLDSGKESCAIMNEIGARERFGYCLANTKPYPINSLANEWYLMGVNDQVKKENNKTYHQIIHEICNLKYEYTAPHLGMPLEKLNRIKFIKEKNNLDKFEAMILINLGGGNRWQYKKWTKEGYIKLINELSRSNPDTAVGIVAGSEDIDFYNEISEEIEENANIIRFGYENSIGDFMCIIYLSQKVVTSDSLAFHIATALDKYVVVIVGPTSHTELDVFDNGKIVYSDKVDCLCCYLNRCSKTVTCMNTLEAEEILKTLI